MDPAIIFTARYLIVLLPLVLLQMLWSLPSRERTRFTVLAIFALILAYLFAKMCSHFYSDPRPFAVGNYLPPVPGGIPNGFPSLHTTVAATIAALVYTKRRLMGVALFFVAILIGTARVLSGVHHALDIVAGLMVALCAVYLAHKLLDVRVMRPRW